MATVTHYAFSFSKPAPNGGKRFVIGFGNTSHRQVLLLVTSQSDIVQVCYKEQIIPLLYALTIKI